MERWIWDSFEEDGRRMVKNIFRLYFVPFLEESFDLNFPVENNKNSAGKKGERRKGKRLKKINDTKFRASFWKRIIKEYLLRLKLNAINYIYIFWKNIQRELWLYSFKRKTSRKIFMIYFLYEFKKYRIMTRSCYIFFN